MHETWVPSLDQDNRLEKQMATHSNIPTWKIPWIEEPGGQHSMGLQTADHDLATECARTCAHTHVPRCGLHSMGLGTVGRDLATERVRTCTHPQPLGHEWIEVCLCKEVQHSRRWAGGKGAKLYLWFLISPYHSHYCLNPSPLPPWKNGLPLNWSLVPKRLGTAAWDFISWSLDENREEKTLCNFWIICRYNSFLLL